MRRFSGPALFALSMLFAPGAFPQAAPSTPPPPVRDPQAIAILKQSFTAMGGPYAAKTQDFQLQGTLAEFETPSEPIGSFIAKSRGFDFSMEVTIGSNTSNYRVWKGIGSTVSNGTKKALPFHTTAGLKLDLIPIFYRWTEFLNSSAAVRYLGETSLEGKTYYLIEVESPPDTAPHHQNELGKTDVLIDETSFLVAAIRYSASDGFFPSARLQKETRYRDYSDQDGVLVPKTIVKCIGGQPVRVLRVASVQFDNGFPNSDFRN